MSASFPGSKLPTSAPKPTACAALIVAATTACAERRPLWWHASAIASCRDSHQVFGLKSVPRATGTPAAMRRRPSANGRWETSEVAGSNTPTVEVRARASSPSEARGLRPTENASRLVHREIPLVDEDIAERRELRARDRLDHVPCDQLDVGVGATLEFGGNRMRSEEGPDHIDAGRLAASRRGPENLQLILGPK